MPAPLIEVKHLKQYFPVRQGLFSRTVGHVRAVDDVSFQIAEGETLGLVGETGCGKTTAGRTLLRLLEPSAGQILVDGNDVTHARGNALRQLRQHLQIVFQDPFGSLNPRMTVAGIVEEGLIIHGLGNKQQRLDKVRETLEQVGLDPRYLNRYPHEFSGGQRQRIGIARALALRPRFMVLDEPISALDVSIQSQIINLLVELREKFKLTYLFISHDLSVVEYISDRVAVMYLGEIVETGRSAELYRHPLHPYTHALLSSVPVMDPTRKRTRILLEGDVPSPINPPSGCRFHPRCPLAMDVCRTTVPKELDFAGHKVRCHAVEKELAGGTTDPIALSQAIREQLAEKAAAPAVTRLTRGKPLPEVQEESSASFAILDLHLDGSRFKNYNQLPTRRDRPNINIVMRVISKRRLREFWQRTAAARLSLEGWYRVVNDKQLAWNDFHAVKATYANASLAGNCVVFNIAGNKFRLIAKINYLSHNVFVRAVLTHEDYDQGKWKADCGCE